MVSRVVISAVPLGWSGWEFGVTTWKHKSVLGCIKGWGCCWCCSVDGSLRTNWALTECRSLSSYCYWPCPSLYDPSRPCHSDHLKLGSLVRTQMKPIAVWWGGSAGLLKVYFPVYLSASSQFNDDMIHNLRRTWPAFIRWRQHKGSLWYWLSLILTSDGKRDPKTILLFCVG